MKIHPVDQGSDAWLKLRAGIPTASRAKDLVTRGGKVSKSMLPYICELIAEYLVGPLDACDTPWMHRGTELEPWARSFYEFVESVKVKQVGFITLDDGSFGYSPDGLVGDDGTLEIKTPKAAFHVQNIVNMTEKHGPQIQAGLMVTERKWCDLISYNPEIAPVIVRVERDEKYISLLRTALDVFIPALAEKRAEVLRAIGREPEEQDEEYCASLRATLAQKDVEPETPEPDWGTLVERMEPAETVEDFKALLDDPIAVAAARGQPRRDKQT